MFKKSICLIYFVILSSNSLFAQLVKANSSEKSLTIIEVFEVKPENQKRVALLLADLNDRYVKNYKGYLSSVIYKSADSLRVISIENWSSEEEFKKISENQDISSMKKLISNFYESIASVPIDPIYKNTSPTNQ